LDWFLHVVGTSLSQRDAVVHDRANGRIKVLHLIDSGGIYGAETVILQLSREMLRETEFEPVVACIVQKEGEQVDLLDKAVELGVSALKVVVNNRRFFLDIPAAALLFRKQGIHLIHSHGYKPSVVGFLIGLAIRIPVIATCHLWFPGPSPPLRYKFMTAVESFFLRFFPKVVCVSQPIKQVLLQRGLRHDQLMIIENGIDVEPYTQHDDDKVRLLRRQLGTRDGEFVIISVGRLNLQKRQENIIAVADALRARGIEVIFLIVGAGELRDTLEDLIRKNGLEGRVRLLGFRDDVKDLLKCADIFFLPSLDEGVPMSLLEAMASKLAVVATAVGGIPALIEDGKDGILLNKSDVLGMAKAIELLLFNRALREQLGQNALAKVVHRYSSQKMFSSYRTIYASVLGKKPKSLLSA
jgi:glycosyltransferase involved in cell wall biosynthesis